MKIINKKIYTELLSQGNYLQISKKLIAVLGLEMAVFLSFLIDQYDKYDRLNELNEDSFYISNNDILIYLGLKANAIQNLKIKGEKLKLFSIKRLGNPAVTYYTINFNKINSIFMSNDTLEELAYKRVLGKALNPENMDKSNLNKLSIKELHILCKYYLIEYSGNDKKEKLVNNIFNFFHKKEDSKLTLEEIEKLSFKHLRQLCKKLKISYSGKNSKEDLKNKIFDFLKLKKVDNFIDEKVVNKCIKKLSTSEQLFYHNQKLSIKTDNEKQNHNHDMNEFENLFDCWNINFTTKNQNSIKNLLNTMSINEVKSYLVETHENLKSNPNVTNLPALFSSKIAKKERQSKFIPQKVDKKELEQDKKEWLSYFAGIISDKSLKNEVESIIINIPIEMLNTNKNTLARMNTFEFKQHLLALRRKC